MASIQKRNGSYRVRIRRVCQSTLSQTFLTKNEALHWAKETEAKLALGIAAIPSKRCQRSFEEVARYYLENHTIHKKNHASEAGIIKILCQRWHGRSLLDINKPDVLLLRDDLLVLGRASSTINHYFNAISKIFQIATEELDIEIVNPIKGIKRMSQSPGRSMRVSNDAEELLLRGCNQYGYPILKSIIQFALETGMRRGEIINLGWSEIDKEKRRAFIYTSKNGESRNIPLSLKALSALKSMELMGTKQVFPTSLNVLRNQFESVRKYAQSNWIKNEINPFMDLRFHDLRHEAISHLSDKGLNVIELSHISGHKTMAMLKRYTHPSHEIIIKKLDSHDINLNIPIDNSTRVL